MVELKETIRQTRIQKKHCTGQKRSKKRQKISWDKFVTNLEHDTYGTQPKFTKF